MLDLIFLRHFGVKQRSITNAVLLIGDLKIFRIFNLISLFESLHSLVQCCKKHLELRKKIKYKIVGWLRVKKKTQKNTKIAIKLEFKVCNVCAQHKYFAQGIYKEKNKIFSYYSCLFWILADEISPLLCDDDNFKF